MRKLSLLFPLLLLVILTAACSKNPTSSNPDPTATPQPTATFTPTPTYTVPTHTVKYEISGNVTSIYVGYLNAWHAPILDYAVKDVSVTPWSTTLTIDATTYEVGCGGYVAGPGTAVAKIYIDGVLKATSPGFDETVREQTPYGVVGYAYTTPVAGLLP
jgi:hypothetical protein